VNKKQVQMMLTSPRVLHSEISQVTKHDIIRYVGYGVIEIV